ncbi:uncharacterized protein LOC135369201 [Ornithodoros turicata]|uniref:uncharacterized protein LOC135369201 n=1 Tax=Ornithodoros turicata TaxID=34597 RepID=UPI003139D1EA
MGPQLQEMRPSPKFTVQLSRVKVEPPDAAGLHEQGQIQEQCSGDSPSRSNSYGVTAGTCDIKEEPREESSKEHPIMEVKTEPYNVALSTEQDQMGHGCESKSEETTSDLIRSMLDGNMAIPRILNCDDVPQSQKQQRCKEREAREKQMKRVLQKTTHEECSANEPPPKKAPSAGSECCDAGCKQMMLRYKDILGAERKVKQDLQHKVESLEERLSALGERLQAVEGELSAERILCRRIQDTLLKKFEIIPASREEQGMKQGDYGLLASSEQIQAACRTINHCEVAEEGQRRADNQATIPEGPHATFLEEQQAYTHVSRENREPSAATQLAVENASPVVPTDTTKAAPGSKPACRRKKYKAPKREFVIDEIRNTSTMTMFSMVDDKVHLGNDVYVKKEKLEWAMASKRDSTFCRELSRQLWRETDLQGRSLSGTISNRYAKTGIPPKPALTPQKVQALANAYQRYVNTRPSDVSMSKRLGSFVFHMRSFLNDMNKE